MKADLITILIEIENDQYETREHKKCEHWNMSQHGVLTVIMPNNTKFFYCQPKQVIIHDKLSSSEVDE